MAQEQQKYRVSINKKRLVATTITTKKKLFGFSKLISYHQEERIEFIYFLYLNKTKKI